MHKFWKEKVVFEPHFLSFSHVFSRFHEKRKKFNLQRRLLPQVGCFYLLDVFHVSQGLYSFSI